MFLEEMANLLQRNSVGIVNSTIFLGSQARIPTGDGPYLTLIATGGTGAARTHTSAAERPSAQVYVRAKDPKQSLAMSRAAYNALGGPDGIYNTKIDNIFYVSLVIRQEPTDVGADDAGRACYSFNFDAEKERS